MKPVLKRNRNRQTKTAVALVDSWDPANAPCRTRYGGRWVMVCLDHNCTSGHYHRKKAAVLMARPLGWCRGCREAAGLDPEPQSGAAKPVEMPVVPYRADGQPDLDLEVCREYAELVERQLSQVARLVNPMESFTPVCPDPFSARTAEVTMARFQRNFTVYTASGKRVVSWSGLQWLRGRYLLYVHHVYGEAIQQAERTLAAGRELVEAGDLSLKTAD